MRTPFQRDRDRIVHSKAFRRLKHKTQVFVAPEGDHYRTRLTHTLEACVISRTVARALGLNEDLTEAIGLGHDLGHPPFGHIGEEVLDEALAEHGLRLPAQRALAAGGGAAGAGRAGAEPDRAGARRDPAPHRAREAGDAGGAGGADRGPGRVHQPRHRRRAAGRDRRRRGTCRRRRSSCWGRRGRSGSTRWCGTWSSARARPGTSSRARRWVGRCCGCGSSCSSGCIWARRRGGEQERAREALRGLFDHYLAHPEEVPAPDPEADELQRVTDYLAGMTDRFCLATYEELRVAAGGRGERRHGAVLRTRASSG